MTVHMAYSLYGKRAFIPSWDEPRHHKRDVNRDIIVPYLDVSDYNCPMS